MKFTRTVALGLAALAFGACSYPDFQYGTSTSTGATSGSSTAGASSGGGMGGGSSSSGSSSSGDVCMVTHKGGGTCEYLPGSGCGCGGFKKCSVVDDTTGASDCVTVGANPLPAWAKCNGDADCQGGTWCDYRNKTCKTICNGAGDCPKGAQCISAKQMDGVTDIPGLKVCTAHCDPEAASPCGANVTCEYDLPITEFDCFASNNLMAGVNCTVSAECAAGLVCVKIVNTSQCYPWCHPVDNLKKNLKCPAANAYCDPLQVKATYNGIDYGFCGP
jgi:hypothetical protein